MKKIIFIFALMLTFIMSAQPISADDDDDDDDCPDSYGPDSPCNKVPMSGLGYLIITGIAVGGYFTYQKTITSPHGISE